MDKVILATDGSSDSEQAAWFLAHLPHNERLELTVLTVLDTFSIGRSSYPDHWVSEGAIAESIERAKANANNAFAKVQQMFEGADVTLKHVVREGHRGETIVKVAEEIDCELVVLGARGHSTVERMLLGSASDYVATHAPCSVLIVRPTGLPEHDEPLKILFGYEKSDAAKAAMEEFSAVRWGRQADIEVVSVFVDAAGFFNEFPIDTTPLRKAAKTQLEEAVTQLRKTIPQAGSKLLESNHVGEGLVQYAEKSKSDLIVVGETRLNAIGKWILGSVSNYVLRHSASSIWIARNGAKANS